MRKIKQLKKGIFVSALIAVTSCAPALNYFNKQDSLYEAYMFPDDHSTMMDDRSLISILPQLKERGYRVVALECPAKYQEVVEEFLKSERTGDAFELLVLYLSAIQGDVFGISSVIRATAEQKMYPVCVDSMQLSDEDLKREPLLFKKRDEGIAKNIVRLLERYGKAVVFLGEAHTVNVPSVAVRIAGQVITLVPVANILSTKYNVLVHEHKSNDF